MQSSLFTPSYFGSIDYFAHLVQAAEVIIEAEDNFQKQTYRNRCYIYGANGKLLLNLPIIHRKDEKVKLKTKNAEISEEMKWKKVHWKSIKTAYQTSPYFEFYEDELIVLFEKEHSSLLELNLESIALIKDLIQAEWEIEVTKEYLQEYPSNIKDLRNYFSPKLEAKITCPKYTQVFSSKYGFIENLSILDLLFNEGPNTLNYLESIEL